MTKTNDETEAAAAPSTGFGDLAQSIGTRNLWIIILAMPAVFLVIVAAIIAIFGGAEEEEADIAAPAVVEDRAVTAPSAASAPIALGAGEAAGAIALDGDRLAVRVDGPDGVVVVVYDIAQGEEIARIPFE